MLASRLFWVSLMAIVLVASGWHIYNSRITAASDEDPLAGLPPAPVAGYPAPDFTLETLEGERLTLSDLKGQPVLINFWASWCGPCRAEMPDLQAVYRDQAASGLVILGVNATYSDHLSEVERFKEVYGVTFPILLDPQGEVSELYNVRGLPTTVFITRRGAIHEVITGPVTRAYVEARLADL